MYKTISEYINVNVTSIMTVHLRCYTELRPSNVNVSRNFKEKINNFIQTIPKEMYNYILKPHTNQ